MLSALAWNPEGLTCHEFCDQALLNARLQKHAVPTLDFNRGRAACASMNEGSEALLQKHGPTLLGGTAGCRVLPGSTLKKIDDQAKLEAALRGLCIAHVTRGALDKRAALLCAVGERMQCEAHSD